MKFDCTGKFPQYRILGVDNKELEFFDSFRKKLGDVRCLNTLKGGNNVSSHGAGSEKVYEKTSLSLKKKFKTSEEFRSKQRGASHAAAKKRMKVCEYMGKTYQSLDELAARTGVPRGSVGYLIKRGSVTLL